MQGLLDDVATFGDPDAYEHLEAAIRSLRTKKTTEQTTIDTFFGK